ncbi:MAG: ABC transporter permease, partial [Chloroflexota bacterium]
MKIREVLHIAWDAINKNKVRSLLTMLGIIIGVASVIIMVSISAGTEAAIKDQITSLGSNLIFIKSSFSNIGVGGGKMTTESGGLVYDDAEALGEVNGVTGVVVEQITTNTVKAGSVSLDSINILGSTADLPRVRDMEIAQGRFFTKAENDQTRKVAVLGASLATELFGEEGPIGQTILVDNTRLNVIGVFEERGQVGDLDYDARLYVPVSVVLDQFTPTQFSKIVGDKVRMIYVEIDDPTLMDDTIL